MTFSIAAVDIRTGDAGVAVASKFLAVGNLVPWIEAGVGAVATQALCNTRYGSDGLELLSNSPAQEVLDRVLAADAGRERRQVGIVDMKGNAAGHTGHGCIGWAGHKTGPGYACQGNCLAGEAVVSAMARTFEAAQGPLYQRLFAALAAGDAAGGDKRGRQSVAVKVLRKGAGYQGLSDTVMDLRVDDAPDPMAAMRRLIDLHELYFFTGDCPRLTLDGDVLATLRAIFRKAGRVDDFPSGWSTDLGLAIDNFIGCENLEERFDLKNRSIDQRALDHLVKLYP